MAGFFRFGSKESGRLGLQPVVGKQKVGLRCDFPAKSR